MVCWLWLAACGVCRNFSRTQSAAPFCWLLAVVMRNNTMQAVGGRVRALLNNYSFSVVAGAVRLLCSTCKQIRGGGYVVGRCSTVLNNYLFSVAVGVGSTCKQRGGGGYLFNVQGTVQPWQVRVSKRAEKDKFWPIVVDATSASPRHTSALEC